jgi:hypothetical protein
LKANAVAESERSGTPWRGQRLATDRAPRPTFTLEEIACRLVSHHRLGEDSSVGTACRVFGGCTCVELVREVAEVLLECRVLG